MEGKTMIFSVLIMSLVMAQIQVDATSCCPSVTSRIIYNACDSQIYVTSDMCASLSGCKIVSGTCPGGYDYDILKNTDDAVNEYCKVGCASSVCGALITLPNSDASEIESEAVEKCAKACSTFCTKGSMTAVDKTA